VTLVSQEFSLSTRNRGTQTQLKDGDIVLKLNSKNSSKPFLGGKGTVRVCLAYSARKDDKKEERTIVNPLVSM
jgi:hypothetical protein